MIDCNKCANRCGLKEYYEQRGEHIVKCPSYKVLTNYDRLISKTPEEMARRIAARTACMDCILLEECNRRTGRRRCVDMWLDWLKSPAEVET